MQRHLAIASIVASALFLPTLNVNAQCTSPAVNEYALPALNGVVLCSAIFDDGTGTGPCLFVGGALSMDGDSFAVAKLVNGQWVPIHILAVVYALTVMDDGTGPTLYAGGYLSGIVSQNFAKWDGTAWTLLPRAPALVRSLVQYPKGPGGTIYAATSDQLLRFGGASWDPVPVAIGGTIDVLRVLDDGSGSKLYIGGSFFTAGGQPARGIAVWDGATCRPVGSGLLNQSSSYVSDIALHDDGSGPKIHIAGRLYTSSSPSQVAALVGNTWTTRLVEADSVHQYANGLISVTDDQGPALYVATGIDKFRANRVRALRNGSWSNAGADFVNDSTAVSTIINGLDALDTASGTMILAHGGITSNGALRTPSVAMLNNGLWICVVPNGQSPLLPLVFSDPGSNAGELYAFGGAMHTPEGWFPTNLPVDTMFPGVRANIDGDSCFVIGHSTAIRVKRSTGWTAIPLPSGIQGGPRAADLGAGPELYTLHNFRTDRFLRKFVNGTWQVVGSAVHSADSTPDHLVVLDLGSGPRLHVVHAAPGSSANLIFQFDGADWIPVGDIEGTINATATFDFGDGAELIVAGDFPPSGSTIFNGLARWNGARLAPVGDGLELQIGRTVNVIRSPSGPQLWAGGDGGQVYGYWNGSAWVRPIPIVNNPASLNVASVKSITPVNSPDGSRSIFLAGLFSHFDGAPSINFAEMAFCPPSCSADFNADGDTGTDSDIEAFFACLSGNCCPTCGTSDFNNDGDFGTDADIESFFRVLAGGSC